MNQSFYHIIFNKTRGQLMVVSDIASRNGKASREQGSKPTLPICTYVPVRALTFSVLLALSAVSMSHEALAQIRADKSAAKHQQATILQTANGLPQVNIQTPTKAGVSVNQYSQFDIARQGVILNNSRQAVSTQLAGWVQGNPHLARGEAKVIVNQVNSREPSHLHGFTEVAGRRAEVVIANPAGIAVNGAGFINAQGVTLATGQVQLNAQGQLTGMSVTQGTVQIGADGLNSKDANYTQLIAKTADIQGGIWANDLSVSTGTQTVSFSGSDLNQSVTLAHQVNSAQQSLNTNEANQQVRSADKASIAIDVGHLGGMYANSIVLVSNDKGVGVNNSGQLFAGQGKLQLSADGQLTNRGEMVATAGSEGHPSAALQVASQTIENHGTMAAQAVNLKAGRIKNNSGLITARHELRLHTEQLTNTDNAKVVAARLDIQAQELFNRQSSIEQSGTQGLTISSGQLNQRGELGTTRQLADEQTLSHGAVSDTGSTVAVTPSSDTKTAGTSQFEQKKLPSLASGVIEIKGMLSNESGQLLANGDIHLAVNQDFSNHGDIRVASLQTSGTHWQNRGKIEVENLKLTSRQIDNSQGRLYSPNTITLAAQKLDNRQGSISTSSDLRISTTGDVDNSEGQLLAEQAMHVTAQRLHSNQGIISAAGAGGLTVDIETELDNTSGLLGSQGDLVVKALGGLQHQAGRLVADGAATIEAGSLAAQEGLFLTQGSLNLQVAQTVQADGAQLLSHQDMRLQAGQLTASNATLSAKGDALVTLDGALETKQGVWSAGQALTVRTTTGQTQGTLFSAEDRLVMDATEMHHQESQLLGKSVRVTADRALNLHDTVVSGQDTVDLLSDGSLSLETSQLQAGEQLRHHAETQLRLHGLQAQAKNVEFHAGERLEATHSEWLVDESLTLKAKAIDVTETSSVAGTIRVSANQAFNHRDSVMVGEQSVQIQAQTVNNQASHVVAAEDLTVTAREAIRNQEGTLLAEEQLQLSSALVDNQGGTLSAQNGLSVQGAQRLHNQSGLIVADEHVHLQATTVNNQGGQVSAGADLRLRDNAQLNNQHGVLVAKQTIDVVTAHVDNQQGQIHAKRDVRIQASRHLKNEGGEILAANTVTIRDPAHTLTQRRLVIAQDATGIIQGTVGTTLVARDLQSKARLETPGDLRLDVVESLTNTGGLQAGGDLSLTTLGQFTNRDTVYSAQTLTAQAARIDNTASGELLGETAVSVIANDGDVVNLGLINSHGLTRVTATGIIDNIGSGRLYGDMVALQATTLVNREEKQTDGTTKAAVIAGRERVDIGVQTLQNQAEGLIFSGGELAIGRRLNDQQQAEGQARLLLNRGATIESVGDMQLNAQTIANENPQFALERVEVATPERMDFIVHDSNSYDTRVNKKDLKERKWSRRASEFVSKGPEDYAQLIPGETPLWSIKNTCMPRFGATCFLSTQLTNFDKYGPDNPAWTYFGITPGIVPEPVAPQVPSAPTVAEPTSCAFIFDTDDRRACRSAQQTWNAYREALSTHEHKQAEYEQAYQAWMATDGQRWHALNDALNSYNQQYQHQFRHRYTEYWITRRVFEDQIVTSRPGDLIAGGNLTINADRLSNDKSRIVAGQALKVNAREIEQIDAKGLRTIEDKGNSRYAWERWRGGFRRYHQREYGPIVPFEAIEVQTIDLPVSVYQAFTRVDTQKETPTPLARQAEVVTRAQQSTVVAGNAEAIGAPSLERLPAPDANQAPWEDRLSSQGELGEVQTIGGTLSEMLRVHLPNSSLYRVNAQHGSYLVETDPAFTNHRQWLSSDYMLQALATDPARMMKRLGDGYYEQRLLNEQILQLTGQRFLDGYENDEAQFKALMQQGVTFAKAHQLTPGIALTAAQVSRLTSDIVWLEAQTVTLPDGTRQEVLVPRVYVKPRQGDLAHSGALLAGHRVELSVTDGFVNSGTVAGRELVTIEAGRMDQALARVQAKRVGLTAKRDMTLSGSSVHATEVASLRAGRDLMLESATYHTEAEVTGDRGTYFSGVRQGIDRLASVQVTNDAAQLLLDAAQDLTLTAALVSNTGQDGQTQLVAGRDLSLGTVTTGYRQDSVADARNYTKEARWQETGTAIQTVGDIHLHAGEQATLRAAELTSEHGLLHVTAKDNLTIEAGRAESRHDERHVTKHRRFLGSKSKETHWFSERDESVASELTAAQVVLQSGKDMQIMGSDLISDYGTQLHAAGDISLSAAKEYAFSDYYEKTKKSGVFGTGGLGFTIGRQSTEIEHDRRDGTLRGSLVGSLAGDTVIQAGRRYRQEASTVSAPQGDVLITGQAVTITAGEQPYSEYYRRTDKQSGLTVAASVPVVDAAKNIQHAIESIGESKNHRTQAMAVANSAWRLYEGVELLQGQPIGLDAAKKASVSVTLGSQKSHVSQQHSGHTVAPSQMLAGKTATVIAHGAGEDSHLRVIGSDVLGLGGTHLVAENDIILLPATETERSRSQNSTSGWNVGVAMSLGEGAPTVGITAGANRGKGYGDADSVRHRQTQTGDSTSLTTLQAGDTTTLRGAQVLGETVQIATERLHIESVQDTATYEGKQQSLGGQLTVGVGASGGANLSRSTIQADYASVIQPSGVYAGDGGYQIVVNDHTELIGGLVTSTAQAEQQGKNHFITGTLMTSKLVNRAGHDGSSVGINLTADIQGGWQGQTRSDEGKTTHTLGGSMGSGNDIDRQERTTASGINTENLLITDSDTQLLLTGLGPDAMAERVFTNTTTETAAADSGALANRFDADAVQRELVVQVAVSQDFSQNVQTAKNELNKAIDKLEAQYHKGQVSLDEYINKREQLENTADLLSAIAAGLAAPTDRVSGIVAASVSPSVAQAIGQHVKTHQGMGGEGSAAHLLAHGLLAGAVAAAGGNDMLSAAGAAITAEAAAPLLAQYLYGKKAKALTADEKSTLLAITGLLGAGLGASSGSHAGIVQGGQAASNAVEHNQLSDLNGLFGVNQWGSGAASLVNFKVSEGATAEEVTEALIDYITGVGYDSGVTDGILIWASAPIVLAGIIQAPAVVANPAVLAFLKGYGVAAGMSIAESVGLSFATKSDYKVSNLVSDLTVGASNNMATKFLVKAAQPIGLVQEMPKKTEIFLNNHGRVQGYFLGSGVSSFFDYTLGDRNKTLIDFSRQKEQGKNHD
ncbi:Filamentous hemagglutinin [Oligella urethralis]|uniref:two-partner secretion domain-containing protein n=1 Tax=Oligella urethralis TaxID=90245 RepID=UPI000DF897AA|nr:hemagglutinin repeat-containing protein [Oligella urethralis]SUA94398.1 Filamentous hemagglutinin [Oligella urethralis]